MILPRFYFIIINYFLFLPFFLNGQTLKQAQEFLENSNYNSAIQSFSDISKKAKSENDIFLLVTAQNGIAECYLDLGVNYKAITLLKQNIDLLKNQKEINYLLLGNTHKLLADCYDKLFLNEDYLKECNNFYNCYRKTNPEDKIYKAIYFAYVGRYYNMRNIIDKAYFYTNNALKIYHKNKKKYNISDAYLFYNAHLFTLRNYPNTPENRIKYQDSLKYFIEKKFPHDNVKKARLYINIAAIHLDLAANNLYSTNLNETKGIINANKAIYWYDKALLINEKYMGFYNSNSAFLNLLKGLMYFYKKEYNLAIENYNTGIKRLTNNNDINKYPFSNNNPLLIQLLNWKSWCLEDMYEQNNDIELLYKTETNLLLTEKVWLIYANNTFNNMQSYNSNMYINSPYTKLTNLYLKLYQTKKNKKYLSKFFEYDEKTKYTALLENLCTNRNSKIQNNATNLKRLNALTTFENVIISNNRKISQDKTNKEYIALFKESFDEYMMTQSRIFSSKDVISLEKLQNQLKENEAILSYNFGGKQNHYFPYIFLITREDAKIINLKIEEHHGELKVEELIKPLENNDIIAFKTIAYNFYQNYFKPIESHLPNKVNHLKILPDSNFSNLPFDFLLNETSNSIDFSNLPYLLKKYQFSYGLSASIEEIVNKKKSGSGTFSIFNPEISVKNLTKLNLTENTAKTIASDFDAILVKGKNATKSNFQKHLMQDRVLTVLTHGKATADEDETRKGFYLSDGFLSSNEVYNYNSNSDFLLLGACETGIGYRENNEGTINLTRAFTSIGVKSIMNSYWKIDEASSLKIIKSFLKYMDDGDTKSAALQKAKIDYLSTANHRNGNPLFWAGLNITGNNETVSLNNYSYYWYLLGLLPLSFLYWIINKKRRSRRKKNN